MPLSINSLKKYEKLLLPAIILLTLAVYLPALWYGFVEFDDNAMVTANPYIQSGVTFESLRWAFTTGYMANWIPLSWISHMLDVQLFGMNPMAHHAGNIVLNAANSALLFAFLKKTTAAPWRSAAVALLFALHPVHVESVVWVAERKDVLCGFFWMLTLYGYSWYVEKPGTVRYLTVLLCFVLGLLAKPMMVTLPVILLLLDWWPLGRFAAQAGLLRASLLRLVVEKVPFLLLSVLSSMMTIWAQSAEGVFYQSYTVPARAARALVSYVTYLLMTVCPLDLAVIYPFSKYPPAHIKVLSSLLFLLLLTVVAFWLCRRFPPFVVGWGWYVISLLPVIGLVQIGQHSVADRYTYLPLIGIFVIAAWGAGELCERWAIDRWKVVAASTLLLILMIALTLKQLSYWKNTYTLFSHAVAVTTGNWVAHHNLGRALLDQGKVDEAIVHFNASIHAKPSYALAFLGLGVARHKKGEYGLSVDAYKSALLFEPGMLEARLGLGLVYLDSGESALAVEECRLLQAAGSAYAEELLQSIISRYGKKMMDN